MSDNIAHRKIIHVDMDAFFASVEQMDDPKLIGKPVAVGRNEQRGVVAAASYEAREFGVRSAMPSVTAKKRCPDLIFVRPHFERYKELSMQIKAIFYDYTDLVEPLSLDEAFLDVTENKKNNPSANDIAREIRERIYNEVGLRASAGISINKFLAKVASDINKPNGQKTIHPDEALAFLEKLPIEKFFGVGKVTAEKMNNNGIYNGLDLKNKDLPFLTMTFGKSGQHYYNIVRGIQNTPVRPNRIRKSVGAERTFMENIEDNESILEKLDNIADELERRMEKNKTKGKTITLKIKYDDFTQQTRSKTVPTAISLKHEFWPIIESLVTQSPIEKPVRLLGASFNNLDLGEDDYIDQQQLRLDL